MIKKNKQQFLISIDHNNLSLFMKSLLTAWLIYVVEVQNGKQSAIFEIHVKRIQATHPRQHVTHRSLVHYLSATGRSTTINTAESKKKKTT